MGETNRCISYLMPLRKITHFHCVSIILTNASILRDFFTSTTDLFLLRLPRFDIFLTQFLRVGEGTGKERKIVNCFGPQFPYSGEIVAYFRTIQAERCMFGICLIMHVLSSFVVNPWLMHRCKYRRCSGKVCTRS